MNAPCVCVPFFRPFAPDSTSAHRDLCLQYLIPSSPGIVVGIDESRQPCLLVRLQEFAAAPAAHHKNHRRNNNQYHRLLQVDTAEKHPDHQHRYVRREVPRSGCFRISSIGTPTSAKALKISFHVRLRPPRFAKYRATARIITSFIHSEG